MIIKLFFIAALASSALSKHIPRYADLDEDDQALFRAAYDAPYEQDEYHEEEEVQVPGKLDLLKGGMWALKTEMKELKMFHKALAAHLLATKLQVKDMLGSLKKPHIIEFEKKKPVYHYQSAPAPSYHQYDRPHYSGPAPAEHGPPSYAAPQPAPTKYEPAKYESSAPAQYPQLQYETYQYAAPPPVQQYGHDPYYGH